MSQSSVFACATVTGCAFWSWLLEQGDLSHRNRFCLPTSRPIYDCRWGSDISLARCPRPSTSQPVSGDVVLLFFYAFFVFARVVFPSPVVKRTVRQGSCTVEILPSPKNEPSASGPASVASEPWCRFQDHPSAAVVTSICNQTSSFRAPRTKMAVQRTYRWQLVAAMLAVLLVALSISECSASTSLVASSRLRRVHKSTYSEATSTAEQSAPPMQRVQKSQLLEPAVRSTTTKKLVSTKTKTTVASFTTTLRERVDQAVQKVRARSKEIKMEQEQKRVDRKLRRDQQKQSRDPIAPVEPVNPHNLKMPDCPAGKVYNGRRCVAMGKTPKH